MEDRKLRVWTLFWVKKNCILYLKSQSTSQIIGIFPCWTCVCKLMPIGCNITSDTCVCLDDVLQILTSVPIPPVTPRTVPARTPWAPTSVPVPTVTFWGPAMCVWVSILHSLLRRLVKAITNIDLSMQTLPFKYHWLDLYTCNCDYKT